MDVFEDVDFDDFFKCLEFVEVIYFFLVRINIFFMSKDVVEVFLFFFFIVRLIIRVKVKYDLVWGVLGLIREESDYILRSCKN